MAPVLSASQCPLCNADVGPFLIHGIRSDRDYQKYFLRPPPSSDAALIARAAQASTSAAESSRSRSQEAVRRQLARRATSQRSRYPPLRPAEGEVQGWGERLEVRREDCQEDDEQTRLETAVERRKQIYRYGLYAKVSSPLGAPVALWSSGGPVSQHRPAPLYHALVMVVPRPCDLLREV